MFNNCDSPNFDTVYCSCVWRVQSSTAYLSHTHTSFLRLMTNSWTHFSTFVEWMWDMTQSCRIWPADTCWSAIKSSFMLIIGVLSALIQQTSWMDDAHDFRCIDHETPGAGFRLHLWLLQLDTVYESICAIHKAKTQTFCWPLTTHSLHTHTSLFHINQMKVKTSV